MPRGLMENIHQRLQMYVLMSKVELEILPDCIGIGLSGNTAGQRLQEQLGMLPGSVNAVSHEGSTHVLQVPGILDRYEIWGEFDVIQPLWQSLANDIMPAGSNTWRYLDIQAGLPMVLQETVESFIPQMVNLQSINGVNFKKGCYPGQEIVARMQYLGTLKRRMYRCKVTGTDSPAPGTALVLADGDNGQSIGEIVDARPVAADTSLALAVITIAQAEMSLQVKGSPEYRVEVLDLPYPVEIPKK
jgi:folate-binding protein YgfZ